MATLDINDLASLGVIRDMPAFQLPPEAWSLGENIRFVDEGVERLMGWSATFGTPSDAPHFTLPITTAAQTFWPWVSLTKAWVWDGTDHTEITRESGAYTATTTADWNGTILGGILVLNNGIDDPQYWSDPSPSTKLADLPNWPTSTKAKVIRAFGPYLVAINITKSGSAYPHMVKWSHAADPGSVPSSWDQTDPTVDAGENDLADTEAGGLIDALPLQSALFLYKQGSTWRMTNVGGQFIFKFEKFLETSGILAARCACITGDGLRHVVATQDDIIVHNGNVATSILDKRQKRTLASAIDSTNFGNSFIFTNSLYNEVWFCYPSQGQTIPNRALIWNYKNGEKGAISEADIAFGNAVAGPVEIESTETWASVTGPWTADTEAWSTLQRRKVVACNPGASKFYLLDSSLLKDGANYNATLQREAIAVIGKKRNGEWIVDFETRKMYNGLWPKVTGGPVNIRLGVQDFVNGPISWTAPKVFDPTTMMKVDFVGSGRALALEIGTTAAVHWRIDGYKFDISPTGRF